MMASVPLAAQERFTIPEILSPAFPFDLVSAKAADRIAWIEYERGMRNLYTAVPSDFRPVRLTEYLEDDGRDLSELQISDDGSVLLFVRGHEPNREGWIANPASEADGAERAAWAVRSGGGAPWRVAEAWDPDGSVVPTVLRTGVGTGTITYNAAYPDKDAGNITTDFIAAAVDEQVLTLAKHARCQVNANKRVIDVALFNLAGAANDWANGDQFLVRIW